MDKSYSSNKEAIATRNVREKKKHLCPDCGKPIHRGSVRCASCAHIAVIIEKGIKRYPSRNCPDCGVPIRSHSTRCQKCYHKYASEAFKGENHNQWRGGRWISSQGYVVINLSDGTKHLEHRLVWEKAHGRKIPKGHEIHHLNGIKTDNRPENLACLNPHKHNKRNFIEALQARIKELEQLHLPI